jgi:hypothetical protein
LLESLFPLAYELIRRALRVVDDGIEVAQPFRDTLKSEAQTFLDATKPISKDASAADTRRSNTKGKSAGDLALSS